MTDLTDYTDAARITELLAMRRFEPEPPNLARENEALKSEVAHLEVALEDAQADVQSLRSLLGIVVRYYLDGEVTITPDQMRTHPHSAHGLGASAQTVTGELVLRTVQ